MKRQRDILGLLELVEIKNYPNLVTLHGGSDGFGEAMDLENPQSDVQKFTRSHGFIQKYGT